MVEQTLARGAWAQAAGLALALAVCFGVAWVGSQFTTPEIPGWYAGLRKPAWTPPNWLFGPVWTALYLSMAVAAWLVWRGRGFGGARLALALFAAQLALNGLWSVLFFGLHRTGLAFAEILLLWSAILATTLAFRQVNTAAAALMLPYLAWVSYAAALNFAIWRMSD
jgi:translocator protein